MGTTILCLPRNNESTRLSPRRRPGCRSARRLRRLGTEAHRNFTRQDLRRRLALAMRRCRLALGARRVGSYLLGSCRHQGFRRRASSNRDLLGMRDGDRRAAGDIVTVCELVKPSTGYLIKSVGGRGLHKS
jgi:hypothetical protein